MKQPSHIPTLADASEASPIAIDVARLIATRLLVQANSGGGKSWAIRRLLEQTHGLVQHIVIDPDGEYHTLREKYDYVLAGRGGDCPATVKAAPLLARRLLELGCSAIIDISELQPAERLQFVKKFLEAMMEAPRSLWHDVLVVVDEAHKFCAEGDSKAPAHAAVVDLASRGRKRGFACVLATQRIAKLDKSAAAECNNKLIGRTGQDVDVERAAKELGMKAKDAWAVMPFMMPGAFYAFGPALAGAERPVCVKVGGVQTTHPDSGKSRSAPPTPPRAKIKELLGELANLPAEAEEEAKTVEQLRAKVRELTQQVNDAARAEDPRRVEAALGRLNEQTAARDRLEVKIAALLSERDEMDIKAGEMKAKLYAVVDEVGALAQRLLDLKDVVRYTVNAREVGKDDRRADRRVDDKRQAVLKARAPSPPVNGSAHDRHVGDIASGGTNGLSKMEVAMLTALAQHREGLSKPKLLLHADYAAGGATSTCFAKLVREGWATIYSGGHLVITPEGRTALGTYTPLPLGDDLRFHILSGSRLSDMEKKLLDAVCGAYPEKIGKRDVLGVAGYAAGGATSSAFARLVAFDYVKADGRGHLVAAEELFG